MREEVLTPSTSLKCETKVSRDWVTGLLELHRDSAHWRALQASNEMMNVILAWSPENWHWHNCIYCNRNPLHSDTSPEYIVGLAMGQVEVDALIGGRSSSRSELINSAIGSGSAGLLGSITKLTRADLLSQFTKDGTRRRLVKWISLYSWKYIRSLWW